MDAMTGRASSGRLQSRRHLAPEEGDPAFALKRRRFLDGLERAISEANRKIIADRLANGGGEMLDGEAFLRLAMRVAELRARYIEEGLACAASPPDRAAITRLAECRVAYEEMRQVFEATERVVERGYVDLPG